MARYNENDIAKVLAEKDSERVSLTCPRHNYGASKYPPKTKGCRDCWMAYYVYDLATTPPSMRAQRLDELESVIRHVTEYATKGKWDFEPEQRVTHKVIRDGFDDATQQYRDEKITIEK